MGYGNPLNWEDGARAEEAIGRALGAVDIEWLAGGSAYWTLSVPSADADQARALIRGLVTGEGISARVIEPEAAPEPPLSTQPAPAAVDR
ncbi:hypothetical protein Poly30_03310 [Planctomycetes bacterium Poly30]|uniref:Uncharacterized protein n=1 Tax=Saltatorellus ferox TaxID=2528018 RepID=A0A518EL69_9BACT|nr:hypothetical protein Poly30_03310 [Planctomycetes bacterium Poly30]